MEEVSESNWPFHPDGQKIYERHSLQEKFTSGPNYNQRAWHHLCVTGRILPYSWTLCSTCGSYEGLDIIMPAEQIEEWNRNRISWAQGHFNA